MQSLDECVIFTPSGDKQIDFGSRNIKPVTPKNMINSNFKGKDLVLEDNKIKSLQAKEKLLNLNKKSPLNKSCKKLEK